MEYQSGFPTPLGWYLTDAIASPSPGNSGSDSIADPAVLDSPELPQPLGLGLLKILTVRSLCGYFSLKTKYFKTPKAISIKVIQIFINVIINPWTIPISQFAPPFAPPNCQCALNLDLE
ncbi:hypothetical protein [Oscillatoria sp. HE19RPO]|uniref:hypothetical protein n=1 Tax=Oscillatoria sp. HE19RPO TaxID=2954806 RepID=UPI0020C27FBF|nr:hypothetical protein [Oscillatoria sp. HE19RPO]